MRLQIVRLLPALLLLLALPLAAEMPKLNFERTPLVPALKLLSDQDRGVVDQAIELIQSGQHSLALARLSSLNARNPNNSSLLILTAFAELQVGNLLGAFEDGVKAEGAPNGSGYKCLFLAKLALVTGQRAACQREIAHLKEAGGDAKREAKAIEKELKKSGS